MLTRAPSTAPAQAYRILGSTNGNLCISWGYGGAQEEEEKEEEGGINRERRRRKGGREGGKRREGGKKGGMERRKRRRREVVRRSWVHNIAKAILTLSEAYSPPHTPVMAALR